MQCKQIKGDDKMIFLDLDGVIHQLQSLKEYENARVFLAIAEYKGARAFVEELREVTKKRGESLMVISKTFVPSNDERYIYQYRDKIHRCGQLGFMHDECVILPANVDKNVFGQQGDILIDDYGHNIKLWEQSGGIGIQFNEYKKKDWITARNYGHTIDRLKLILSAKAIAGDMVV
jgi:hypothetical protein